MTGKVESKTKNTGKRWVRRLGALWLALTAACTGAGMPALAETSIPNQTQQQSAAVPASGETATAETSVKTAAVENETGAGETGTQAAGNILTDTVSPVGTTINLFDYWITTRFAPDNVNPADMDQDINAGKLLQFTAAAPRNPNGGINDYTGSDKPRTGIVQNTLQNGYPVLSQGDRSLAYLFNPNLANAGKASFPGVRNLLQIDDQR